MQRPNAFSPALTLFAHSMASAQPSEVLALKLRNIGRAQSRVAGVYGSVSASTGVPTADQQAQIAALTKFIAELAAKAKP